MHSLKKIYVDRSLRGSPLVENIQQRKTDALSLELVEDYREVLEHYFSSGRFLEKDTLLVHPHPGSFLSTCPGSGGMVCCNYFVINLGLNCIYDCHYCFLQTFQNQPLMTLFGNLDHLFAELDRRIAGKGTRFRVGTGEYSDSLALDPLLGLSPLLVEYFAKLENATLELKTKSAHVEELLELDHRGHTVVSWSMNPPSLIQEVEEGAASLEERLEAARKVQEAGYSVAIHLDPILYGEGWEEAYGALIDRIFQVIDPDSVAWISLGGFRYSPGLKEIVQVRFPEDRLTTQEMVQGSDGKYRYFKSIREEVYRSLIHRIRSVDPRLFVYLCMETGPVWQNLFGFVPESARKLDSSFEERRLWIKERRGRETGEEG